MASAMPTQLRLFARPTLDLSLKVVPEGQDQVSIDRAWARHYAAQGLRAPITREIRSMPNDFRIANYHLRVGRHRAAHFLSNHIVKC